MSEWHLEHVLLTPDALETDPSLEVVAPEWEIIDELSNVDVRRLDFNIGARWRTESNWGYSLFVTATDYEDRDPILVDETGEYSTVTFLVGKSF